MTTPDESPYDYGERKIADMSRRSFALGQSRISGYLSLTLGLLSFLAVLAWRFPAQLTTRELREVYDPEQLRVVLMICMWASLLFGSVTFVRNQRKRLGALGVLLTLSAFALGGYHLPAHAVDQKGLALGVDWLVLDFLLTGGVFIFVEKLIPRYAEQAILRWL